MKLSKFSSFVVAAVMFLVCAVAPARAQWHNWSQGQRNNAIVSRALTQNGAYTGVQCKEWVQNVVYSASGGAVWLPLNQPNLYQWYPSPNVWAVPYCPSIYSASPGSVIQMKWNSTPHTAIVYSTTGSGMWWIDCNWNHDTRVTMHFVSYSQFMSATSNSFYTVYYVR
ncbi:MAG: hypothetical protein Q7R94_02510 [bacterium]|nr:hypothetical protein [bacterium]